MRKSYESPEIDLRTIMVEDVLSASNDPFGSNDKDNGFDLGGSLLGGGN